MGKPFIYRWTINEIIPHVEHTTNFTSDLKPCTGDPKLNQFISIDFFFLPSLDYHERVQIRKAKLEEALV